MCTVTWWHGADGAFEVLFNRDEQRSRLESLPPAVHQGRGFRFVAPVDPQGGGTWFALNENHLCVCLLNSGPVGYEPAGEPLSRGCVAWCLAGTCETRREAMHAVLELQLERIAPFHLMAIDPSGVTCGTWDGLAFKAVRMDESVLPFSTSSVRAEEALQWRTDCFDSLGIANPEPSLLKLFHHARNMDDPALGVCMDREDARTVSFCHGIVRPGKVEVRCSQRTADGGFGPARCSGLDTGEVTGA